MCKTQFLALSWMQTIIRNIARFQNHAWFIFVFQDSSSWKLVHREPVRNKHNRRVAMELCRAIWNKNNNISRCLCAESFLLITQAKFRSNRFRSMNRIETFLFLWRMEIKRIGILYSVILSGKVACTSLSLSICLFVYVIGNCRARLYTR